MQTKMANKIVGVAHLSDLLESFVDCLKPKDLSEDSVLNAMSSQSKWTLLQFDEK